MKNDLASTSLLNRTLRVAGWVGLTFPLLAQLIYSKFFCHYALLPTVVLSLLLIVPALVWQLRKYHMASLVSVLTVLFWVVWENQIQCVSTEGPFVGGLGVIYLLILGVGTSVISGLLAEFLERRMHRKRSKQA